MQNVNDSEKVTCQLRLLKCKTLIIHGIIRIEN